MLRDKFENLHGEAKARAIQEEGMAILKKVRDWVEEHQEECQNVIAENCSAMTEVNVAATMKNPKLLFFDTELVSQNSICFQIGYYLGRTYQDVPKVFKDALR